MRLYLVQHGAAVDKSDDARRPLSADGKLEVQAVAARLGNAGIAVSRIWHSGKLRAEQTATILAGALMQSGRVERIEGIAPNDPVDEFARDIDVWQEDTLVVGHLPFMGRLVAHLVCERGEADMVAFTPGTVVCLEPGTASRWHLCWMLAPQLLGGDEA